MSTIPGTVSATSPSPSPSARAEAAPTSLRTMRAVAHHRYGRPEDLAVVEVERPTPARHQVLVEVAAAGIDRGVWHLVTGLPFVVRLAGYGLTRPKQPIPGMDLAGRVVAVGADVTRFEVGDEVFGIGTGTFARYAVADEAKLARRPAAVSPEVAAAASISGLTALQALREVGGVAPGQRVLVLGASGGVGSFAVQIAKYLGAHVTGVASSAKLDLVRALGADDTIDYTVDDALAGTYDLIVDTGGRHPVRRLRRALDRRGTLVIVGGEGGGRVTGGAGRQLRALALSPFVPQRLRVLVSAERGVEELAEMLDAGVVRPAVDRTYPLEQAPAALADLDAGRISGKAVVTITEPS